MIITSRFFDVEEWSMYATLQTIIILSIMKIGFPINNLKVLVLSSMLAFMSGDLLPRLIYTFFLCMLVWSDFGWKKSIRYTIFTLLGVLVVYFIKKSNSIYSRIYKEEILKNVLRIGIILWMCYIPYMMISKMTKKVKRSVV